MAEANPNPQGTQSQAPNNGAAANNPAGSQQQQAQDPAWFQHIPDQYREEAKKSYLLHSDYTKKSQELAEQRKAWEAEQSKYKEYETKATGYDKWWNEFKPTYEVLQKNWDKIQSVLQNPAASQNQQGPGQQQNGQSSQNYFENWDLVAPEEQAKRVADFTMNERVAAALAAQKQEFNQTINQEKVGLQNYLAIFTDAISRKLEDPSLDIGKYIAKATEYSYGRFNPMEAAYHSLTEPQKLEKLKEEWMAKGREEAELAFKNKQQSTGAFENTSVPFYKRTPLSKAEVADAVRKEAIAKGMGW